jgi:hypothetical protein
MTGTVTISADGKTRTVKAKEPAPTVRSSATQRFTTSNSGYGLPRRAERLGPEREPRVSFHTRESRWHDR